MTPITPQQLATVRQAHARARAELERCQAQRNAAGLRDKAHWQYWQACFEVATALFDRLSHLRWSLDRGYRWQERLDAFKFERESGQGLGQALRGLANLYWAGVQKFGWLA